MNSKLFGEIFFLDILYDFSSNNTEEKNLIVGQLIYIYKRYKLFSFNDTNSKILKKVIKKMINNKYLKMLNIRKIKRLFKPFFL